MIFDLWDTLAIWPHDAYDTLRGALSVHIPDFDRVWKETYDDRQTGSMDAYFRKLGLDGDAVAECTRVRTAYTRGALVPREGTIETLDELRGRGLRVGLISVCSADVPEVWDGTAFSGRFDATVFSASCGLVKPQPEIYLLACERLGVEPQECLFVGDGANDELAGAERVGIKAACILRPGADEALWPEARGWEPTIRSIPDVLELAQEID